jgi:hypothetical protein
VRFPAPRFIRPRDYDLLDGEWKFAHDVEDRGLSERWYLGHPAACSWASFWPPRGGPRRIRAMLVWAEVPSPHSSHGGGPPFFYHGQVPLVVSEWGGFGFADYGDRDGPAL